MYGIRLTPSNGRSFAIGASVNPANVARISNELIGLVYSKPAGTLPGQRIANGT